LPSVPDYELLRRIGGGAYGEVWLARSKATGVFRAAKIVWRHTFEDNRPYQREFEGIQRFERISREHPSQLALFHVGRNEAEGYFYYVMELADDAAKPLGEDGGLKMEDGKDSERGTRHPPSSIPDPQRYAARTLRAELEHGRLPAERVLEIGVILTEALGNLHKHGLVHRDVKPSNVIFVNGRPKLADIGLVTDASDQCSIVGTEGYLPPEGPGTPQADIFAFGKVLYEASTGLDRREFPDLPAGLEAWPEAKSVLEMNQVVLRGCAADIRARYQSADEMRRDLLQLKDSKSLVRTRRSERRWRNVRRGTAWLAATAAILALLALANHALHPATAPYVEKRSTNSLANEFYDRGRTYFDQFTSNDLAQAVACFQTAITNDPTFAAPYGYLAVAYSWWSSDGWNVGWRDLPKARTFAERALTLDVDDSLAEPHLALGWYHMMKEWDWSGADAEYKKAMRLSSSTLCRLMYAEFLRARGQMKEALAQISEAKARDPNSRIISMRYASYLRDAHKFKETLAEIDRTEAMGLSGRMEGVKVSPLCALGRYKEAVDVELQILAARSQSDQRAKDYADRLKSAVEFGGTSAYWRTKLEVAPNIYERACCLAQLEDGVGAMQALDEAAMTTNVWLTFWVMTDWRLDPIRSDGRFGSMLKRMHLQ